MLYCEKEVEVVTNSDTSTNSTVLVQKSYSIRDYFLKYEAGKNIIDTIIYSVDPDSIVKSESYYSSMIN